MGAVEEGGKLAGGVVDSLKAQPLSLALVVMNILLLGYLYYDTHTVQTGRLETVKMILDQQKQVHELLSRCVVPERRSDLALPKPKPLEQDYDKPKALE